MEGDAVFSGRLIRDVTPARQDPDFQPTRPWDNRDYGIGTGNLSV